MRGSREDEGKDGGEGTKEGKGREERGWWTKVGSEGEGKDGGRGEGD